MRSVAINGARVWAAGIFATGIFKGVWSYLEKGEERGFLSGSALNAGARGFFVGCTMAVIIPPTELKKGCQSILEEAKWRSKGF